MLSRLISYCWTLLIASGCYSESRSEDLHEFVDALIKCYHSFLKFIIYLLISVSPAAIPIDCFPGITFCTFSFSNVPAIQDFSVYTETVDSVDGSF